MIWGKSGRFIGQWVPESDCEIETNKAGVAANICCIFNAAGLFLKFLHLKTCIIPPPAELDPGHGRKGFCRFMFSISFENNASGWTAGGGQKWLRNKGVDKLTSASLQVRPELWEATWSSWWSPCCSWSGSWSPSVHRIPGNYRNSSFDAIPKRTANVSSAHLETC